MKEGKLLVPKDAIPSHTLKTSLASQKMQSAQTQNKLTYVFAAITLQKTVRKAVIKDPK